MIIQSIGKYASYLSEALLQSKFLHYQSNCKKFHRNFSNYLKSRKEFKFNLKWVVSLMVYNFIKDFNLYLDIRIRWVACFACSFSFWRTNLMSVRHKASVDTMFHFSYHPIALYQKRWLHGCWLCNLHNKDHSKQKWNHHGKLQKSPWEESIC